MEDGQDGEPAAGPLLPAEPGNDGGDACSTKPFVQPGPAKPNPTCGASIGGSSGVGVMNGSAGSGDNGQPNSIAGGLGEGHLGAELSCQPGQDGTDGMNGIAAMASTSIGAVTSSGYAAPEPVNGGAGQPAHGGGGGGGAKGTVNECSGAGPGASGGSGGPGGCGGIGGHGGHGGGSSIALISVYATVSLTDCLLSSGHGGDGGKGADGQVGQKGGDGGKGGRAKAAPSTKPACDGGKGGYGGDGGPGAGGLGGHSLAVAFKGVEPAISGGSAEAGLAGHGGMSYGYKGETGVSAVMHRFP